MLLLSGAHNRRKIARFVDVDLMCEGIMAVNIFSECGSESGNVILKKLYEV